MSRAGGLDPSGIHVTSDHAEAARCIREVLRGGDRLLVKGSRAMHMERVVHSLCQGEGS